MLHLHCFTSILFLCGSSLILLILFCLLFVFFLSFHIIWARAFCTCTHSTYAGILVVLNPNQLRLIFAEGPVLATRAAAVLKSDLIALAGRVRLIRDAQIRVRARTDRSIGTSLEPLLARLLAFTEPDARAFVN